MPKNIYYEDVKIIKKPLKKRIKSFLIFLSVILIFIGVFFISTHLSNALSVGNISGLLIYGDTTINIKSSKLYAITLGEYESKEESEKVSLGTTIQGASGYVWEDGKYFVIGSIYSSLEDSEKVVENLKDSNYTVGIKEIVFPKLKINFDNLDNKSVSKINDAFIFIDDLYSQLYDYSITFDKGEINNFAVSSNISEIRGECKVHISTIQSFIGNNNYLQKLQNTLIYIDEILDETILKTIDNSTTNYTLKNSMARVVRLKYDLYNELSTM